MLNKFYSPFLLLFFIFNCNTDSLVMNKITKSKFQQITTFVSENLNTCAFQRPVFSDFPSVIFSFKVNKQNLFSSMPALQESLVIFYSSSLDEVEPFLDFLILHLTVGKRPKCLLISRNFTPSTIESTLKVAWKKKFLDFSIINSNLKSVHFYNPFTNSVHHEEATEIFPDKLQNGFGYPVYISNSTKKYAVMQVRRPNRGVENHVDDYFHIGFLGKTLNFNIATKNSSSTNYAIIDDDLLKKWNLDVHSAVMFGRGYQEHFYIPTDGSSSSVVAFVPIISTTSMDLYFKTYIIFGVVLAILYVLDRFHITLENVKVFDIVKILLGQSATYEPQKTVHRIIFLTIIVASVKITSDLLLGTLLIKLEKRQMPFETYEDLHKSGLKTYTDVKFLKDPKFFQNYVKDAFLQKTMKKTIFVADIKNCFDWLKSSKNVSCITFSYDPKTVISKYRSPDGTPTMKDAHPAINTFGSGFYWFADGSPYAGKFLEILRRVKETDAMHWPVLVERNRELVDIEDDEERLDGAVELEHLLVILSTGYLIAVIIFIMEMVVSIVKVKVLKYVKCRKVSVC